MNILPFVTILILVIALTISSFFGGFKESSFAKIVSTGLINAYRLARNSSEEDPPIAPATAETMLYFMPRRSKVLIYAARCF